MSLKGPDSRIKIEGSNGPLTGSTKVEVMMSRRYSGVPIL